MRVIQEHSRICTTQNIATGLSPQESIIYHLAIIARANSFTGQQQTQGARSTHQHLVRARIANQNLLQASVPVEGAEVVILGVTIFELAGPYVVSSNDNLDSFRRSFSLTNSCVTGCFVLRTQLLHTALVEAVEMGADHLMSK